MPIWNEFPYRKTQLRASPFYGTFPVGLLHHCSRHQPLLRHARLRCARALWWHWATTLLPALPRWPRLFVPSNCPNRWPEMTASGWKVVKVKFCLFLKVILNLRWNMMGKSASLQSWILFLCFINFIEASIVYINPVV